MSQQQLLSQLSVDNIRKHVRHIVDSMPSRLAGTPNAARMAEYSAAELRAAGLEARIEAIPGLVSFPREAKLTILSPEPKAIPANTFGHSVETPPEGVCGDLVYVGSRHFADYDGKDVAGKITLSALSYSPGRHEKQRIAALMGSTAQIMRKRNWGHAKTPPCRSGRSGPPGAIQRLRPSKPRCPSFPASASRASTAATCSTSSRTGPCACGSTLKSRMAGAS